MWRAWVEVASNRGAAGIDGVSIAQIESDGVESVRAFLDELAGPLRAGRYRPKPLQRVHIPKPGKPGQSRPLGIPTIADRVVMTAAKIVCEPIFDADFLPVSFVFRPKRSAHQALETSVSPPTVAGGGCSMPISRHVSTTSTTTPLWVRSSAGSLPGSC
jgi:RNA-directed DNA polymerase